MLFAASISGSVAASGCRFWMPFCTAKLFAVELN
jgi:hypothetical protein